MRRQASDREKHGKTKQPREVEKCISGEGPFPTNAVREAQCHPSRASRPGKTAGCDENVAPALVLTHLALWCFPRGVGKEDAASIDR